LAIAAGVCSARGNADGGVLGGVAPVQVLEALPDDDDATQLAVRALAQVKLNTSAEDPESSSYDVALVRKGGPLLSTERPP